MAPYGTRRFNAVFTRAFQLSISCAESTQFLVLIPIFLRSILKLSSHLRLGLPKCLFPGGVPIKHSVQMFNMEFAFNQWIFGTRRAWQYLSLNLSSFRVISTILQLGFVCGYIPSLTREISLYGCSHSVTQGSFCCSYSRWTKLHDYGTRRFNAAFTRGLQ